MLGLQMAETNLRLWGQRTIIRGITRRCRMMTAAAVVVEKR